MQYTNILIQPGEFVVSIGKHPDRSVPYGTALMSAAYYSDALRGTPLAGSKRYYNSFILYSNTSKRANEHNTLQHCRQEY